MTAPGEPRLLPLRDLEDLGESALADALAPLFETAAPLTRALARRRPFASYAALVDAAEAIALGLPEPERIEVLNAHPRIGEPPARLSALSRREQGYPSSAARTADQSASDAELARLNDAYEARFGFRFVVFVDGRPRAAIVDVLRERLGRPRDEEMTTGLREMFSIARDRLSTLGQRGSMPAGNHRDGP